MTYLQQPVIDAITTHAIPVQIDNSQSENNALLHRIHHIWTPDLRVLGHDGFEFYRWDGFLPPPEYTARALCGFGVSFLRQKRFDHAIACFKDVLTRFSTTYAAPEANYYLGVAGYRKNPDGDDLLDQWAQLRSRYPMSEHRMKQSFKELP